MAINTVLHTYIFICFSFHPLQMVASSVQAARKLVEKCEFSNDETRANNGVLIGKGHPHVIPREQEPNIETCLTSNNIDIRETPSMATTYKSALLPLCNLSSGGTVYKSGNEVCVLLQRDEEVIMKIIHFYLLCVEKQYISIAIGDRYNRCNAANGEILRHPLSDGIIVHPFETNFCVLLKDITRKVMLYPYHPGQFAVIDPGRTVMALPRVLVPVYPQIGDMVLVKGDDDELWRAHIRTVDRRSKIARGYFFVKHRNWNDNQQWVRESQARAMDTILFKSIVGLVEGQWHGSYWKDS